MSKLTIHDMSGALIGEEDFPEELLEYKRGIKAVRDVIVAHLASCRRGTASTLSKGEVAGSNRKPWRQKGTGRARAGFRQSPVWRGGGVAFGPHPRKYNKKINKKVRALAFRRAISQKIFANQIKILNELSLKEAKTKHLVGLLKVLCVDMDKGVLLVDVEIDKNIKLAARNLKKVSFSSPNTLDTYKILRYPTLIISATALKVIKERISKNHSMTDFCNAKETETSL